MGKRKSIKENDNQIDVGKDDMLTETKNNMLEQTHKDKLKKRKSKYINVLIIGESGIGKSTLANIDNTYIDLESGNFWYRGHRHDDWYIHYGQIAQHLSQQGYNVFVSSHKEVRNYLKDSQERVICIYPSILLAEEWKQKLKERYAKTQLIKDYKAWKNAEDRYHENISELMMCGIPHIEINSIDYNLKELIERALYVK